MNVFYKSQKYYLYSIFLIFIVVSPLSSGSGLSSKKMKTNCGKLFVYLFNPYEKSGQCHKQPEICLLTSPEKEVRFKSEIEILGENGLQSSYKTPNVECIQGYTKYRESQNSIDKDKKALILRAVTRPSDEV